MKRNFLKLTSAILLALSFVMCKQQPTVCENGADVDSCVVSTPQEAITKLMAGNERYVNGKSIHTPVPTWRECRRQPLTRLLLPL